MADSLFAKASQDKSRHATQCAFATLRRDKTVKRSSSRWADQPCAHGLRPGTQADPGPASRVPGTVVNHRGGESRGRDRRMLRRKSRRRREKS
jgi:hypothetical protein